MGKPVGWPSMIVGVVLGATVAACSAEAVPATTPAPTTTTAAATTAAPATTSTAPVVTAALDRRTEIEAIFQDLEERRLDALYRKDEEAFRALFANEGYLERSLVALELTTFVAAPEEIDVEVLEVYVDEPGCIAVLASTDLRKTLGGPDLSVRTVAMERGTAGWGYSLVYSESDGWKCAGSHPFG